MSSKKKLMQGAKLPQGMVLVMPTQRISVEEETDMRAARAELCLWQLLQICKQQTNQATWANLGLLEAEGYLDAIATGGQHPLIKAYKKRAKHGGRRSPPRNEIYARRLMVLATIALRRAGVGVGAARTMLTTELKHLAVLAQPPTDAMLENWEQRMPRLTPADEILLVRALTLCGIKDLRALMHYFITMVATAFNPRAVAGRPSQTPIL